MYKETSEPLPIGSDPIHDELTYLDADLKRRGEGRGGTKE